MARSMRNFRIDDDVYAAAQERARREYTNVTAVIERYLAEYGGLIRQRPQEAVGRLGAHGDTSHDADMAAARLGGKRRTAQPYSKQQQAGRGKR